MPDLASIEQFLRTTYALGAFAVFGTLFLLLVVWVCYKLAAAAVSIFDTVKEWLPRWLKSQVEFNMAQIEFTRSATESLGKIEAGVATLLALHEHREEE